MHKRFNPLVYVIGVLAAAIPDLVKFLLAELRYHPQFATKIAAFNEFSRPYPWALFIFGVTFGIAALATEHSERRAGMAGLFQYAILLPVGTWLVKFFLLFAAGALIKYGVPMSASFYVIEVVSALLIFAVAQGALNIDVGPFGYLGAVVIVTAAIILGGEPYKITVISNFFYTLNGLVLSYYLAQYFERPVRE